MPHFPLHAYIYRLSILWNEFNITFGQFPKTLTWAMFPLSQNFDVFAEDF